MKTASILVVFLFVMIGCSAVPVDTVEPIDHSKLNRRNGVYYEINSNEPFTGRSIQWYMVGDVPISIKKKLGFKDGLLHGEAVAYYLREPGAPGPIIENVYCYELGVLQGKDIEYYKSGQVKNERNVVDGATHGEYWGYYENGQLMYKATSVHGRVQGRAIEYNENGSVKHRGYYVDGEEVRTWSPENEEN